MQRLRTQPEQLAEDRLDPSIRRSAGLRGSQVHSEGLQQPARSHRHLQGKYILLPVRGDGFKFTISLTKSCAATEISDKGFFHIVTFIMIS